MYHPHQNSEQRLEQQRQIVDQLRQEASIKRINVSQAIEEIRKFVIEKQCEDVLLTGFASAKQNPYWKKSKCKCELM